MQTLIRTLSLLALLASPAAAQSLSPLVKEGNTPSAAKAFRLLVGNPYKQRMTFILVPMDVNFEHEISGAVVKPAKLTLAPNFSRNVIVQFDIDPKIKERTIGLCVMPEAVDGPVLPRVCGLYTGHMLGAGG
jgi:hypothetical protein